MQAKGSLCNDKETTEVPVILPSQAGRTTKGIGQRTVQAMLRGVAAQRDRDHGPRVRAGPQHRAGMHGGVRHGGVHYKALIAQPARIDSRPHAASRQTPQGPPREGGCGKRCSGGPCGNFQRTNDRPRRVCRRRCMAEPAGEGRRLGGPGPLGEHPNATSAGIDAGHSHCGRTWRPVAGGRGGCGRQHEGRGHSNGRERRSSIRAPTPGQHLPGLRISQAKPRCAALGTQQVDRPFVFIFKSMPACRLRTHSRT